MNKKIASEIAVGIILLIAIVVGGVFWLQLSSSNKPPSINNREVQKPAVKIEDRSAVCTQEAKLCEDGKTYASRTGPNCEFAACPSVDENADWKTYTNTEFGFNFNQLWVNSPRLASEGV